MKYVLRVFIQPSTHICLCAFLILDRNLVAIQDREICCYSISCKEKDNIGKFQLITALIGYNYRFWIILFYYFHAVMRCVAYDLEISYPASVCLFIYFRYHTSMAHPPLKIPEELKMQELCPCCLCHVTVMPHSTIIYSFIFHSHAALLLVSLICFSLCPVIMSQMQTMQ